MKVRLIIPSAPVAKARPRAFTGKSGKPIIYTPKRSKRFENKVTDLAMKYFPKPFLGPVKLHIRFLLPRPKRLTWKTKPMPECYCPKRPDIDNLAKAVTDGLNGVAYVDDKQIVALNVEKLYHAGYEAPKTIIEVQEIPTK